jgi:hypothetical protein
MVGVLKYEMITVSLEHEPGHLAMLAVGDF